MKNIWTEMEKIKKYIELVVFAVILVAVISLFALGNIYFVPYVQSSLYKSEVKYNSGNDTTKLAEKEFKALQQKLAQLNKKNERLTPGGAFLIINTTDNTFNLYKNNQVIRRGFCSTGSFIKLEVDSTKSYTFETPKGVLTVQNKITDPVWKKPDWAFIEEGLPVPSPNHPSRYERGVLGDYALSLGDGYLIHGTLYQRFIGMPVTHGCVRLGDADLEAVYNTLQIGSKVFIY